MRFQLVEQIEWLKGKIFNFFFSISIKKKILKFFPSMFEHKLDSLSTSEYADPFSNRGSMNLKHHFDGSSGSNRNVLIAADTSPSRLKPKDPASVQIQKLRDLKNKLSEDGQRKNQSEKKTSNPNLKDKDNPYLETHQVKFKITAPEEEEENQEEEEDPVMNKTVNFASSTNSLKLQRNKSNEKLNQTAIGLRSQIRMKNVYLGVSKLEVQYERVVPVENNPGQKKGKSGVILLKEGNSQFSIFLKNKGYQAWPVGLYLQLYMPDKKSKKRSKTSKMNFILFGNSTLKNQVESGDIHEFKFDFSNLFDDGKFEKINMIQEYGSLIMRLEGKVDRTKYFSTKLKIGFEVEFDAP